MKGKHSKSIPGHKWDTEWFSQRELWKETLQKHPYSKVREGMIFLKRLMKGKQSKGIIFGDGLMKYWDFRIKINQIPIISLDVWQKRTKNYDFCFRSNENPKKSKINQNKDNKTAIIQKIQNKLTYYQPHVMFFWNCWIITVFIIFFWIFDSVWLIFVIRRMN